MKMTPKIKMISKLKSLGKGAKKESPQGLVVSYCSFFTEYMCHKCQNGDKFLGGDPS